MNYILLYKAVWGGVAALGFAALFNVPARSLVHIFLFGATGVFLKLLLLANGINIVLASLIGAAAIGFLSIPAAHNKHTPPLIFYIPAVIPMVPGVLAYKMMLGLIKLTGDPKSANYVPILSETVNYGIKVLFILISLSVGVIVPMLLVRKDSVKDIKVKFRKNKADVT
jgi:uncharacterized membrane protein YjjB (DUF3815 family)